MILITGAAVFVFGRICDLCQPQLLGRRGRIFTVRSPRCCRPDGPLSQTSKVTFNAPIQSSGSNLSRNSWYMPRSNPDSSKPSYMSSSYSWASFMCRAFPFVVPKSIRELQTRRRDASVALVAGSAFLSSLMLTKTTTVNLLGPASHYSLSTSTCS